MTTERSTVKLKMTTVRTRTTKMRKMKMKKTWVRISLRSPLEVVSDASMRS